MSRQQAKKVGLKFCMHITLLKYGGERWTSRPDYFTQAQILDNSLYKRQDSLQA